MSKRSEMSQLDRVEMKLDFIFGIMSNQTMASEFLQAYHGETAKKDGGDQVIVKKAEEMFLYHNKNVKDSISYFVEFFGADSNQRIVELVQENVANEPEPVAKPETASNHTSEKVK